MDVEKSGRVTGARAVVLAAGASTRMGAQKLLMLFRGRPLVEYAVDAVRAWSPLVVASPEVAQHLGEGDVILNDAPERGMAHSLALADAALPSEIALIVALGDKPLLDAGLVERLCVLAGDADVVYPVHARTGEPGHPVIFSARARTKIGTLPDGDSLRVLRDDPSLVRRTLACEDAGAFFDVDTPENLAGEGR